MTHMSYSVPLFEIMQIFFTDIQNTPHLKIKSYIIKKT
jgi:hypothetical protein